MSALNRGGSMDNIISLLQDKNFHLQRFHELNETELVKFAEGNFDNLEVFYNTREAILDLVKCIDRLIEQSQLEDNGATEISQEQRSEVARVLATKDRLVTKILTQDLQILSVLESAKSNIIRELSGVRSARKAVGAYHSGSPDPRLDEEA